MHRPTERIARAWTSEREARSSRTISPTRREPTAVTGTPGPVRVYRAGDSGSGPTLLTKRRVAIGTVAATAAIACVAGLLMLTTVDLVSGGSVGKGSSRFTLAGGSDSKSKDEQNDSTKGQEQQERQTPDQEQTRPSEQQPTTSEPTPTESAPTDTAPVTPPAESPPGETVPDTGTP
jgi:hypothetical protein